MTNESNKEETTKKKKGGKRETPLPLIQYCLSFYKDEEVEATDLVSELSQVRPAVLSAVCAALYLRRATTAITPAMTTMPATAVDGEDKKYMN